jgi:glycosyltransferase involved in cell wall biosynthesis
MILRKVDLPIAMSKFAQKQALEVHGVKSGYIPHAVDMEIYKPADKNLAKARWGLQGKFVVGTVARNQGRKMLDRTLKTMEIFCKGRPDVILFMHTDPFDPAGVFDLRQLIRRYNLENRILFSGMRFCNGLNYKEMSDVYNAMDVFLLTTSGEGFGIPTIEAMSCEVPVVVTDYTTTDEIVNEDYQSGFAAKVCAEITGSWAVERAVMDVPDCVEKLHALYSDAKLREQLGKNGRLKVAKEYDWNKVLDIWDATLRKL